MALSETDLELIKLAKVKPNEKTGKLYFSFPVSTSLNIDEDYQKQIRVCLQKAFAAHIAESVSDGRAYFIRAGEFKKVEDAVGFYSILRDVYGLKYTILLCDPAEAEIGDMVSMTPVSSAVVEHIYQEKEGGKHKRITLFTLNFIGKDGNRVQHIYRHEYTGWLRVA